MIAELAPTPVDLSIPQSPIKEIAVIGMASKLGGADTELDHQVHVWQAMGMTVHFCHTAPLDQNLLNMRMGDRGCIMHEPRDWSSIAGMHAVSFCNGEFLTHIEDIKKYAKTTTFAGCMTWGFAKEYAAHAKGLIDFELFQTAHQREKIEPELLKYPTYRPLMFTPYFHTADFPFIDPADRPRDKFRFGRISRPDIAKYHGQQWWIYNTLTAPVLKDAIVLGFSERILAQFGPPPGFVRTYPAGGITQQEFYRHADALIMQTTTYENLPRVMMEAMASGTVPVVDNRGGWTVGVEHGKTGWLCDNERAFVYYASRVAHEHEERAAMARAGRARLEQLWGLEASAVTWQRVFNAMESL